jgi:Tfp pilus assembly protein PilF
MLNEHPSILHTKSKDADFCDAQTNSSREDVDNSIILLLRDMFEGGKFDTTIEVAEQLLTQFPSSIFIHNVLAESYARLGDDIKAINYYQTTMELIPTDG